MVGIVVFRGLIIPSFPVLILEDAGRGGQGLGCGGEVGLQRRTGEDEHEPGSWSCWLGFL